MLAQILGGAFWTPKISCLKIHCIALVFRCQYLSGIEEQSCVLISDSHYFMARPLVQIVGANCKHKGLVFVIFIDLALFSGIVIRLLSKADLKHSLMSYSTLDGKISPLFLCGLVYSKPPPRRPPCSLLIGNNKTNSRITESWKK